MAFKELIGSGYVELTSDDKKLSAVLDRTDKKMAMVQNRASMMNGSVQRALLGGFGFGTAEQVLSRVGMTISDLTNKMITAAKEGKSVGEAIAMWAHEMTGLRNAVSDYNESLKQSNTLHAINERFQERILNLKKEDSDITAARQVQTTLEAELKGLDSSFHKTKGFLAETLAALGLGGAGTGVSGDDGERRRRLAVDIEKAKNQIEEMEDAVNKASAKVEGLRAGDITRDLLEMNRRGRDDKWNALFDREQSERERERRQPFDDRVDAAQKRVDELERTRPSSGNRFMGIEQFARAIQEGANDETKLIKDQIDLAKKQLDELKAIRAKEFGGAVFQ